MTQSKHLSDSVVNANYNYLAKNIKSTLESALKSKGIEIKSVRYVVKSEDKCGFIVWFKINETSMNNYCIHTWIINTVLNGLATIRGGEKVKPKRFCRDDFKISKRSNLVFLVINDDGSYRYF